MDQVTPSTRGNRERHHQPGAGRPPPGGPERHRGPLRPAGDGAQEGALGTPLDMLLSEASTSPLRRFVPGMSGIRMTAALARRPQRVVRRGLGLGADLARIGVGRSELGPAEKDRRFTEEAWARNPLFKRTLQGYLALGEAARGLVADAELEWGDEQRMGFIVDNLVDALAPSNNPFLNPKVLKRTLDTGGANLVAGQPAPRAGLRRAAAGALDGRGRRVRGRRGPRRHPRGGGAAHRRLRADPVHPADRQGPRGAAAGRAPDDQQVLRRSTSRRTAASSSTSSAAASRSS